MSVTTKASLRRFVAAHGGSARAVAQSLGRAGVRLTLIGADGVLGDVVVSDMSVARGLVDTTPGISMSAEWTRELVSSATPRVGHWRKMAGWVAHQKSFPTARNASVVART